MSKDESLNQQFRTVISDFESYPNIWSVAPVEIEPEKWLDSWQIVKCVHANEFADHFGLHFSGRNIKEFNGAISSKIEKFDPVTMRGVTKSGRVYQLIGPPGFNRDADYVLDNWCRINQVKYVYATDEFIKQYGISLENISKLI